MGYHFAMKTRKRPPFLGPFWGPFLWTSETVERSRKSRIFRSCFFQIDVARSSNKEAARFRGAENGYRFWDRKRGPIWGTENGDRESRLTVGNAPGVSKIGPFCGTRFGPPTPPTMQTQMASPGLQGPQNGQSTKEL